MSQVQIAQSITPGPITAPTPGSALAVANRPIARTSSSAQRRREIPLSAISFTQPDASNRLARSATESLLLHRYSETEIQDVPQEPLPPPPQLRLGNDHDQNDGNMIDVGSAGLSLVPSTAPLLISTAEREPRPSRAPPPPANEGRRQSIIAEEDLRKIMFDDRHKAWSTVEALLADAFSDTESLSIVSTGQTRQRPANAPPFGPSSFPQQPSATRINEEDEDEEEKHGQAEPSGPLDEPDSKPSASIADGQDSNQPDSHSEFNQSTQSQQPSMYSQIGSVTGLSIHLDQGLMSSQDLVSAVDDDDGLSPSDNDDDAHDPLEIEAAKTALEAFTAFLVPDAKKDPNPDPLPPPVEAPDHPPQTTEDVPSELKDPPRPAMKTLQKSLRALSGPLGLGTVPEVGDIEEGGKTDSDDADKTPRLPATSDEYDGDADTFNEKGLAEDSLSAMENILVEAETAISHSMPPSSEVVINRDLDQINGPSSSLSSTSSSSSLDVRRMLSGSRLALYEVFKWSLDVDVDRQERNFSRAARDRGLPTGGMPAVMDSSRRRSMDRKKPSQTQAKRDGSRLESIPDLPEEEENIEERAGKDAAERSTLTAISAAPPKNKDSEEQGERPNIDQGPSPATKPQSLKKSSSFNEGNWALSPPTPTTDQDFPPIDTFEVTFPASGDGGETWLEQMLDPPSTQAAQVPAAAAAAAAIPKKKDPPPPAVSKSNIKPPSSRRKTVTFVEDHQDDKSNFEVFRKSILRLSQLVTNPESDSSNDHTDAARAPSLSSNNASNDQQDNTDDLQEKGQAKVKSSAPEPAIPEEVIGRVSNRIVKEQGSVEPPEISSSVSASEPDRPVEGENLGPLGDVWGHLSAGSSGSSSLNYDGYDLDSQPDPKKRCACLRKKSFWITMVIIVLLLATIVVLVAYFIDVRVIAELFGFGGGGEEEETNADIESFSLRYLEMKQEVIDSGASSPNDFESNNSPQTQALKWLADQDAAQLTLRHELLIQRYALAVIFFTNFVAKYDEPPKSLEEINREMQRFFSFLERSETPVGRAEET